MLLIDGGLLFRTFYAFPPLTDRRGRPVGAVCGFVALLLRELRALRPTHVAVGADIPVAENHRTRLYGEYKGNRPDCPPELAPQFDLLREVLAALGVPVLAAPGYEADDVLGTMSQAAEAAGMEVSLLTGDRDAFQLLSGRTSVRYVKRLNQLETYDVTRFVKEWGLMPPQLADLKGLAGDPSDNIPGIRGIGPKTATRLLQEFGTVEGVLDNAHTQAERLRQRLEEGREIALLSKRLATIERAVPGLCVPDACRLRLDRERGLAAFDELGFRSLRAALR